MHKRNTGFVFCVLLVRATFGGAVKESLGGSDDLEVRELTHQCAEHVLLYQQSLANLTQAPMWVLAMFDSSTKSPDGLLAGSWTHMGNFDECVRIRDILSPSGYFNGKYCLVDLYATLPGRTFDRQELFNSTKLQRVALPPVKIATCIPSSCLASDVQIIVQEQLKALPLLGGALESVVVNVDEVGCRTGDYRPLDVGDWICISVLLVFLLLLLLSSTYDKLYKNKEQHKRWCTSFSVITNAKALFNTSSTGDSLNALHGIRFLSIAWIALCHQYVTALQVPSVNLMQYMPEMLNDWARVYATNGSLAVDTFFVLSGLLTSYVFLRQVNATKKFNVPLFYIHRYIRITPPFAILILLSVTIVRHFGYGPLWDIFYTPQRENCANYWWSSLLYVSNYVNTEKVCIPQSWFLSIDMQLYWLSPLLLIPLWKKPMLGVILCILIFTAGIATVFAISFVNEIPAGMASMLSKGDNLEYMNLYYLMTHARFPAYISGIFLGYILHNIKTQKLNISLTKYQTYLCWLCCAGMMLIPLMIVQILNEPDYTFNNLEASFYTSLHRPIWSLGICALILLCTIGYGGYVNSFLSWKFFVPLSRLSFGIYLTHMHTLLLQRYSLRTSIFLNDVFIIPGFFGNLVFSVLISIILSLMFESPFMVLEKEFLGNKNVKQTTITLGTNGKTS